MNFSLKFIYSQLSAALHHSHEIKQQNKRFINAFTIQVISHCKQWITNGCFLCFAFTFFLTFEKMHH